MKKSEILELLREYRSKIIDPYLMKNIRKLDRKNLDNLYDGMLYHLDTGGKRWRPTMCLLICEAYGGSKKEALPLAATIEIHHNWTLIHDDIEDGDEMRRDKPTVWKKYGLPHGINIGDAMNEVAYFFLKKGREKWGDKIYADVNDLLHKHLLQITEGQTMDMNFRNKTNITGNQYMSMIRRKTGDLVVATVVGAAMISDAPKKDQEALRKYSYKIGPAFQIRDDLLDYEPGKGRGEKIGCDVREGKRSLMVIYAFNNLSSKQKKELICILDKNREETTREDVKHVRELLENCGAFKYAEKKQKKLAGDAKAIVKEHIPKSDAKDLLLGLSQFLIKREL